MILNAHPTAGGGSRFRHRRRPAFTLIELLIVVAIIAILAAIAVPNFLEAQTRAKVSRMKADVRSLATGVESYAVDNNVYPLPSNEEGGVIVPPEFVEWFETRMPVGLTTPIAYMTSIPRDIFAADANSGELPLLHFSTHDYVLASEGEDEEFDELIRDTLGANPGVRYFILSHGPDMDHDFAALGHEHDDGSPAQAGGGEEEEEEHGDAALYDPTNGTVSNGDVVYWGPGIGFLDR
jgi:prepilin-type N-terminal cleavage/methylation domain-containing protein